MLWNLVQLCILLDKEWLLPTYSTHQLLQTTSTMPCIKPHSSEDDHTRATSEGVAITLQNQAIRDVQGDEFMVSTHTHRKDLATARDKKDKATFNDSLLSTIHAIEKGFTTIIDTSQTIINATIDEENRNVAVHTILCIPAQAKKKKSFVVRNEELAVQSKEKFSKAANLI
ncbi:hypothetical protein ACH5RR_037137 [Cinchona calisaya]|uniref:Uncharacterized protein n=1 Tax=Cinchona calisaya TaxID=153742 RepID=A0ABD2Y6J1_9GENT